MTDVASQSNSRPSTSIPAGRGASLQLPIPVPGRPFDHNGRIAHDAFSPVTQYGSFEFDRIIKAGELYKRTRKTKKWKPIFIVLRPNLLSIYPDKHESKLRHQINLSELTAIARQRDPKRPDRHIFGLFSPSRNFHLEAASEKEAQEWVDKIRQEAKIDEDEEEIYVGSPMGVNTSLQGFDRSIDANLSQSAHDRMAAGYSSSDAELVLSHHLANTPRRDRGTSNLSTSTRHNPHVPLEYSGAEHGSMSDFSDSLGARMSSISLANTDGRPSTSSVYASPPNAVYSPRPSMGARNPSQMSTLAATAAAAAGNPGAGVDETGRPNAETLATAAAAADRVICHGWIHLLKSTSGVRQWKRVWMVLRAKALAVYKNDDEYAASLVLPFASIIDVVEIDPISKSKTACMQVISEERNYRFCAVDEESLARWLGAFKSLLSKRKLKGT